jgi:ABC-type nitrate/sulfonate/bicarbonate transport system substrate-binding protein
VAQQTKISHGYYQPYFYWMFPIVVAREAGLFTRRGVELDVHDIVAGGQPEDKAGWYKDAFDKGSRDFYFCCAWQGVYSTCETGKGKIGTALKSTLIKTFAIYTRPDSGINDILDLANRGTPVAVNLNADAHYVTLKNLLEFFPEEKIKLAHIGGVEKCLEALMSKKVDAATLAGPYAEAAEAMGYRKLMPLSRSEPTLIVFNDSLGIEAVSKFVDAINEAIRLIDRDRKKYAERFRGEFSDAVRNYIPMLKPYLEKVRDSITLPVWAGAEALGREEFEGIHSFLMEQGLSVRGRGYDGAVETRLPPASGPG